MRRTKRGADGVVRPAKRFCRTDHPGLRPPLLCEEGNVLCTSESYMFVGFFMVNLQKC